MEFGDDWIAVLGLNPFLAETDKRLESLLDNVVPEAAIDRWENHLLSVVHAEFAARREEVKSLVLEIVKRAGEFEKQCERQTRTLLAESEIKIVTEKASESLKKLERAKRDVGQAESKLRNAMEDGGDIAKAEAKLSDAKCRVIQCRAVYEQAVAAMLAVRQSGYPEMQCVAAANHDPFPCVPTIGFGEMGDDWTKIGGGAFADVLRVELPVTGPCAFKQLRHAVDIDVLMKEAAAMWQLRHSEHVVRLLKVCTDAGHQGLLLELAESGSLGDLIHQRKEKLAWGQILQALHDVASGLECVHEHSQVHLDVKADNILLTRAMRAKLGDFGAAKRAQATFRDTKLALTMQWRAPEMLQQLPRISPACDIWSFGMLVYELATGKVPYENVKIHNVLGHVVAGKLPDVSKADRRLVRIMQLCWHHEPNKRPSAAALVAEIGALMSRPCCSCMNAVVLSKGILSSDAQTFLCGPCVPEALESQMQAARSDGTLVLGEKAVFELHSFKGVIGEELLLRWQNATHLVRQREIQGLLDSQVEAAKRKWEAMSIPDRVADAIRNDVLPCRCPKCRFRLFYEGGCFALTCTLCHARFCAFCESVFANGEVLHEHVSQCPQNVLRVDWLPPAAQQQATFAPVQRVRQIRQVRERLAPLDEETRSQVLRLVNKELATLKIGPKDLKM